MAVSSSNELFAETLEASPLYSKVALADSVEDALEASPLCSKVALADSVEDPLEASPLCSKVALTDSVADPLLRGSGFGRATVLQNRCGEISQTIWFKVAVPGKRKNYCSATVSF